MLRHSICFQSLFPDPSRRAPPPWQRPAEWGEGDAFEKGKRRQMSFKTPWTRKGAWRWLSFAVSGVAWGLHGLWLPLPVKVPLEKGKQDLLLISCESQQLWYFSSKLVTVEKVYHSRDELTAHLTLFFPVCSPLRSRPRVIPGLSIAASPKEFPCAVQAPCHYCGL